MDNFPERPHAHAVKGLLKGLKLTTDCRFIRLIWIRMRVSYLGMLLGKQERTQVRERV